MKKVTGSSQFYLRPYFFGGFSTPGYGAKGEILQATRDYSQVPDKGSFSWPTQDWVQAIALDLGYFQAPGTLEFAELLEVFSAASRPEEAERRKLRYGRIANSEKGTDLEPTIGLEPMTC